MQGYILRRSILFVELHSSMACEIQNVANILSEGYDIFRGGYSTEKSSNPVPFLCFFFFFSSAVCGAVAVVSFPDFLFCKGV